MRDIGNEVIDDVNEKVRRFIIENFLFGNEAVRFEDTDSFLEKGIIDSTGILELIGFLEESFSIKIEDHELIPENLDSVRNVGEFVNGKRFGT
jgi:acyl carrier protein